MLYNDFLSLISYKKADNEDILYIPVSKERGQNQKVYDFDNFGLTLWVWRKKSDKY